MADFSAAITSAKELSDEAQKSAGAPVSGKLSGEHLAFLKTIKRMIESGEIDPYEPKSFLKKEVYETLNEEELEKTDIGLMNIARLLREVYELYISKQTPDESPQYTTMIDHLWQMKERMEEHHDVLKF